MRYGCWTVGLVVAFASMLLASDARAQGLVVKGVVSLSDGSAVDGAVVELTPTEKEHGVRRAKSDKEGRFSIPFLEPGKYVFHASKDELLTRSFSITIHSPTKQLEYEQRVNVALDQKAPEIDLRLNRVVDLALVVAPRSGFEDVGAPSKKEELMESADSLTTSGKFAESDAQLDKLDATGSHGAQIAYLRGLNAAGLNRKDEAVVHLQKAIEIDPMLAGVHGQLGMLFYERGEKAKAEEQFEAELKLSPSSKPVAINLALALVDLGRKEQAIDVWKRVIALDPSESSAYQELSSLYSDLGRQEEASKALKDLEQFGKKDPGRWFNIGVGYANAGKETDAETAYRKALEADPRFPDANRELGYLMVRKGDVKAAIAFFRTYLEIRPDAKDAGEVHETLLALEGGRK